MFVCTAEQSQSELEDDNERPPGDQVEREDEATPSSPGMSNMSSPSLSPGEKTIIESVESISRDDPDVST